MSILWALILAVVQGLTEFLPVSSSAHLAILGALAGIREEDALAFFLVLHMGTLLATLAFFWKDLWALVKGLAHGDGASWRYVLLVAVTTVPTGIIGLALKDYVEEAFASPAVAGGLLFVTAAALLGTRFLPRGEKADRDITWLDALLVGIAQGVAVFPGISRSGATICACLARKVTPEAAFRYSFLASLPAIAGAFLLEARGVFSAENPHVADDVVGFLFAFLSGFLALVFLRRLVTRGQLYWFAIWCVITGSLGLGLALLYSS